MMSPPSVLRFGPAPAVGVAFPDLTHLLYKELPLADKFYPMGASYKQWHLLFSKIHSGLDHPGLCTPDQLGIKANLTFSGDSRKQHRACQVARLGAG